MAVQDASRAALATLAMCASVATQAAERILKVTLMMAERAVTHGLYVKPGTPDTSPPNLNERSILAGRYVLWRSEIAPKNCIVYLTPIKPEIGSAANAASAQESPLAEAKDKSFLLYRTSAGNVWSSPSLNWQFVDVDVPSYRKKRAVQRPRYEVVA